MSDDTGWYSEARATLGDRLAGAREAAQMSQKSLATRLGVKRSTIERWEHDQSEPRANRLSMLSGLLGVSLTWLLTGIGEGVAAPAEEGTAGAALPAGEVLAEMAAVRLEMSALVNRLWQLEERLRDG